MSTPTLSGLAEASEFIDATRFDLAENVLRQLIFESSELDQTLESGQVYSMLSITLEESGDFQGAIQALENAVHIFENSDDDQSLPFAYLRMAEIKVKQEDWDSAKDFLETSLKYAERLENGPVMLRVLVWLIVDAREQQDFELALKYISKATEVNEFVRDLALSEFLGNEREGINRLVGLGDRFIREFQKAKDKYHESNDFEKSDDISLAIASVYCAGGNLERALAQLELHEQELKTRGQVDHELLEIISATSTLIDHQRRSEARNSLREFLNSRAKLNDGSEETAPQKDELLIEVIGVVLGAAFRDADEVISDLLQLRDRAVASGNTRAEGQALVELGKIFREVRNYERSREALERSLEIAVEDGELFSRSLASRRLAELFLDVGDFEAARSLLTEMESLCLESGYTRGRVSALMELASADFLEGVRGRGRKHLRSALRLARESNDLHDQAEILYRLARLDSDEGNRSAAIEKLRSAISIARENGQDIIVANALLNLTGVYWDMGDYGTQRLTDEAKKILLGLGEIARYANSWRDASSASQARREYDRAIAEAIEALNAFQHNPLSSEEAVCFFQIGSILRDQNRRLLALEFMTVAIWIDGEVGSEFMQAHLEHVAGLAVQWQMQSELTSLGLSASKRYGSNRGQTMIENLAKNLNLGR